MVFIPGLVSAELLLRVNGFCVNRLKVAVLASEGKVRRALVACRQAAEALVFCRGCDLVFGVSLQ